MSVNNKTTHPFKDNGRFPDFRTVDIRRRTENIRRSPKPNRIFGGYSPIGSQSNNKYQTISNPKPTLRYPVGFWAQNSGYGPRNTYLPVFFPRPFSPVQRARKFSQVFGVMSANSSNTIRPTLVPEMVMSKKQRGRLVLTPILESLQTEKIGFKNTCIKI